ncbi:MAG: SusC/RagA family TonB-linked outer membrane protein [Gemmatimonadota bacterium]
MTRVRKLLAALTALTLSATGIGAQQMGNIAGQISDATTLQPLDGVTVSVGQRRALSQEDGRFLITGIPSGTYTLTATRVGYAPYTQTVTVAGGQTTTLAIRMISEAVRLEGLVVIGYGERQKRQVTGVIKDVAPEEFNAGRIVSPEQLIQGKVAGVQIIDSGEPGGGVSLRIRGGTSVTSSNEPLFVVDGVPLSIGGGISAGRNPLNFINPEDIESVTVLKDASATAIYGSRGANGVVIIQTKSGAKGARMTYTGSVSGSNVIGDVSLLDATQFRNAVAQFAPDNLGKLGSADTNWRKEVQRSAVGQEHSVAISGGDEAMDYRLSLGYLNQEGVVRGSATERVSAALNFHQVLLDDRLDIEANLKGSRAKDLFTPGGVLGGASGMAPTQPVLDPNSPYGGYFEWDDPLGPNNPVAELNLVKDDGTTYRSVGSIIGKYDLPWVDGLLATVNVGYDVTKAERRTFAPSFLRGQAETGLPGLVSRSNPTQLNKLLDAYLNYETAFGPEGGDLDLTAGYSYEDFRSDFPSFVVQGLSFDLLGPDGIPGADLERTFLNVDESRLISAFARLNYSFQDKYLLTASIRRDGSSKFGPEEQWGTFPSAAFAWRISNESFMEGFDALSDLKLRVSWGVNGNQAFPNYQQYSDYLIGDPQARAQFGDEFVTTIRPSAADPGIKWEETTSYNIGVDFTAFDGRLSGALDYYKKDTKDLIFNVPVAAGTNLSNFVTTNIGSLTNKGFELGLDAAIFESDEGGFTWNAGFNLAANDNELTQINATGAGDEQILTGGIAGGVGSTIQVLQPGFPVNSFFVYRHKRGADGLPIYADTNGDGNIDENDLYEDLNGDGVVNQDDRAPWKSPAPDFIIGHTSMMSYGNWDASFTLLAQIGNYVYNNVASNLGNYRELRGGVPFNLHSSVLEYGFDNPQYFSDVYVEDASFLRMDNIVVGYTIDRAGLLQGARLFAAVQNVFTLTGYSGIDPVAGVNGIDNNIYPRSRTFTGGLSVSF